MKLVNPAVSHLRAIEDTLNSELAAIEQMEESSPMTPASSDEFAGLFEYLRTYDTGSKETQPVLLHIGCGDGRVGVMATRFNLCSESIGIDASPLCVHMAIKLAFEQKVLSQNHFFRAEIFQDPSQLLGNIEKIWDADVVFLHAFPSVLKKLIPLLAKMSDDNFEYMLCKEKKKRKFITLMYHFPADVAVNARFIKGTDLCVYDGILDKPQVRRITRPTTHSRLMSSRHSMRSTLTNH